ncbi:uncharacterized protein LOC110825857 [Carica papaya]|uniref:uncharacterized protein LOC110825857 n=1 Tax=Carica papaya TaxID=3649 RepID=UPI000B8C770E|nr:uncharacterized protein LOC110825857 [Carica papaya]
MYPPPLLLPFPHFNSFMELRKKTRSASSTSFREFDELAMVKAAAWAWFQRGSGSEGKPTTQLHIQRTQRQQHRPSRYKLEAMSNNKIAMNASSPPSSSSSSETPSPSPVHADDNSLLDSYEIQCISRQLHSFISDSAGGTSSFHRGENGRYRSDRGGNGKKMSYASKILKGILLRHAAVCGRREDVDTRAFGNGRRRSKPPAKGAISTIKDC